MSFHKKIQDISSGDEESKTIDIGTSAEKKKIEVSDFSLEYIVDDIIQKEDNQDIVLHTPQEIKVEKKKGKRFDALELKKSFSPFFGRDTIVLKNKKEHYPLSVFFLRTRRYFSALGTLGLFVFFSSCLLGIVFLGYLDKVFVENRVNAGYQKLLEIREGNLSFIEIQKKVNNARFDLLLADTFFMPYSIFSGDKINSVDHVISGGKYLSKSLDNMLSLVQKTKDFIEEKPLSKIYFTQLFVNIFPEIQQIELFLETSLSHYKSITWLPESSLEEKRKGNIIKIENILSYIRPITQNFNVFLDLLGHSERKRYLVVFQNTDEIRPTGGFMGSMGLVEIFRGQVQIFQKKDVYAIEWDLKKSEYERLPAPKGINELTDTFGLRDANYYIHLKDSSQAIKFFTDRAGIQIDGIIYINQNILLRLLKLTGPVYFEPLEREITADNFSELMSLAVEAKTFKEGTLGTPKQVLFDFMEVFSKKLIEDASYFDYLQSIFQDVESRDMMMWSFDEAQQELLGDLKLDGTIQYDTSLDFTYPVYTSLSGNKSDRYMKRKYRQSVQSTQSCDYKVKLEIQSTHDMGKKKRDSIEAFIEKYNLTTPNLLEVQGADRNRQFVRIILPKNAEILPQIGLEIVDYGQRSGVEFFLDTQLQETSFYTLEYLLKNPDCRAYSYTFYKQSGIPTYDIIFDFDTETFSYPQQEKDFYFEKR